MNKKILVTGADGFIGSHLIEMLVRKGYDVKAFVLYNSFNSYGWLDSCSDDVKGKFEIFSGDIRDSNGVKEAMRGCSTVMHLAALIAIPYSYHSPDTYIDTNVKGTLNVLQAAKELNVEKIIQTSTSEVYGTAQFVPISENHPVVGQSPYSASKIAADHLAYSFYASFDMPVMIIRPFNTYGPRQSARAVIPSIIIQIAKGKKKISLGSVKPKRDFNYVEDTVSGFVSCLNEVNSFGEIINIGSNFEVSIQQTFELIKELMNSNVELDIDIERVRPMKSEVNRLLADNKKAKNILKWSPKYGGIDGFEKGLEKTISWFTDEENLKNYKDIYNI